jgi:positive regulator of sigma E activity
MLLLISLMNGQASSSLFAAVVYYAGIPLLVLILCTYMVFRRFANVEKQKRKIMLMAFVSGFLLSWALVFLWDLLSTDISWLI